MSDTPAGAGGNALSIAPTLAADASLVAFAPPATDLDTADTNGVADVYARRLHVETARSGDMTAPLVTVAATAVPPVQAHARRGEPRGKPGKGGARPSPYRRSGPAAEPETVGMKEHS